MGSKVEMWWNNFDGEMTPPFNEFKLGLERCSKNMTPEEFTKKSFFNKNENCSPIVPTTENTGAMPRFSFTSLGLSKMKNVRSRENSVFFKDGLDEVIESRSPQNENEDELNCKEVCLEDHLDANDDDENEQEMENSSFWQTNKFVNSPLFKKCIGPSKFVQSMTLSPVLSPLVQRLKDYERSRKVSGGMVAIKELMKTGNLVMGMTSQKDGGSLDNFLHNVFQDLCYLNQRSIILKMIDKNSRSVNIGMNEKYISAYNAFRLPVTFMGVKKLPFFKDRISNKSGVHIFDGTRYWLRNSSFNGVRIHAIDQSTRHLHNEVVMLAKIDHPNIVKYYSSWIEYQVLHSQLEYAPGGNLETFLKNDLKRHNRIFNILSTEGGTKKISIHGALRLITDIASALDYIQGSLRLVHGNISTFNIMIFPVNGSDSNVEWMEEGLQGTGPIIFKLAGFERCVERLHMKPYNKDLLDLGMAVLRAMKGVPTCSLEELWSRIYPIESWCSDSRICHLLKVLLEGIVDSADRLLVLIASLDHEMIIANK